MKLKAARGLKESRMNLDLDGKESLLPDALTSSAISVLTPLYKKGDWNSEAEWGAGWQKPSVRMKNEYFAEDCYYFDTRSMIKNFIGFNEQETSGPFTYSIRVRIDYFLTAANNMEFIYHSCAGTPFGIQPNTFRGARVLAFSWQERIVRFPVASEFDGKKFSTITWIMNGSDSKIKIGSLPSIIFGMPAMIYRGLVIGKSFTNADQGPGFRGCISRLLIFNRAIGNDDLHRLHSGI